MPNPWRHALCDPCYAIVERGRQPARVVKDMRQPDQCCRCGKAQNDGIYYRADPTRFICQGETGTHHDE